MLLKFDVQARAFQSALPRLAVASVLAGIVVILASGCENKTLGRSCDVTADAGPTQGAWNSGAADCPSRLCIKPALQPSASGSGTSAYCTASCTSDSDCDGQTRDTSNPNDKRCVRGFTCAVIFGQGPGPVCCTKLCLCRDFVGPTGVVTPPECQAGGTPSCQ